MPTMRISLNRPTFMTSNAAATGQMACPTASINLKKSVMNNLKISQIYEPSGRPASLVLGWPFDIAHFLYALTVRAGLIKDSMLANARFSRDISALEKLTLGPWARQT
jgi:hypothetical protein